jgi:hypothetical protein
MSEQKASADTSRDDKILSEVAELLRALVARLDHATRTSQQ